MFYITVIDINFVIIIFFIIITKNLHGLRLQLYVHLPQIMSHCIRNITLTNVKGYNQIIT